MKKDFVAKTLAETSSAIQNSVFAGGFADRDGLMQRLDPRIRIVSLLALLIVTGLARDIGVLCALYGLTLVMAVFSRLPLFFFIKRVWAFIPIFAGIIAIPALFITPGHPVFTVLSFASPHHFGPFSIPKEIVITAQGAASAAMLVMRVATSVSFGVLLVLTTRWEKLLKALCVLRMPEILILILAMTYRYIQLFMRTVEGMFLARKSRQISDVKLTEDHGWLASRLGVLVGKSYRMSNDVHLAMISRGWSENPRLMNDFKIRRIDRLWLALTATLVFLVTISG
ncbi:MAG: cobalt ECF transporter T component CbiQ [Deltaproteobacteria bacterium]|nr:cobalt ECF transporter T component CbiQ [Deltaproteobacteria bacterium]